MRLFNSILAALVAILLFGGAMEGGLRLIGFGPPTTLNRFDAVTGWSKTPGLEVQRSGKEYEVDFAFNSVGLRDDEGVLPDSKKSDQKRILVLGDSFVLGFSVQRQDLFVDLLDGRWGSQAETVNVGTEGWSTDQAVAWLEDQGNDWQPDVVLLMPYENDLYWNTRQQYMRHPKPRYSEAGERGSQGLTDPGPAPLRDRSALARLFLSKTGSLPRIESNGHRLLAEHGVLLENGGPDGDAIRRHTSGCFKALARWSQENGTPVLICPIPAHSAVDEAYAQDVFGPLVLGGLGRSAWDANRPVDLFLELAAAEGLATLDARPALSASLEKGEQPYFSIDWHLNPTGNRVLADVLHDELARLAWVPPGTDTTPAIGSTSPSSPFTKPALLYALLVALLGTLFARQYPDEKPARAYIMVAGLLGLVFGLVLGSGALLAVVPQDLRRVLSTLVVLILFGFIAYKLGDRLTIIAGLMAAFIRRGHWYLMPLLVVLLTVGSLLVVAASSPLVAPFIYTLF
jgi:hypothetical protein